MKTNNRSLSSLFIFFLVALMSFGAVGCKNKKKIAEQQAAAERAAKITKAKTDLQNLLADNSKSPEEMERELARIKAQNLNDPEVNALIRQVEEKISQRKAAIAEEKRKAAEEAERLRKEAEERERNKPVILSLNDHFNRIIGAANANEANTYINEALKLFASPETPVLITIGVFDGEKDYDKPTTIRKYLEYLKDQKKNLNNIQNIMYDGGGKIKELELMRKK